MTNNNHKPLPPPIQHLRRMSEALQHETPEESAITDLGPEASAVLDELLLELRTEGSIAATPLSRGRS